MRHLRFLHRPRPSRVAEAAIRAVASWLALVGLVVQLSAAGLCAASASGPVLASPFPICHSHDDGDRRSDPRSPDHADHCPCCGIHAHGLVVFPPTLATVVDRRVVVAVQRPPIERRSTTRPDRSAASPRGPPREA